MTALGRLRRSAHPARSAILAVVLLLVVGAAAASPWEPHASGGNAVEVDGDVVCIDAMKAGVAYATVLRPYDGSADYTVSFEFKLRTADAHSMVLWDDGFVHVATDWGADLGRIQAGKPFSAGGPVARLDLNRWHRVEILAYPFKRTYDLVLDGKKVSAAVDVEPARWLSPDVEPGVIEIGDPEKTSFNHGSACWRSLAYPSGSAAPTSPAGSQPGAGQARGGSIDGTWRITLSGALNQSHLVTLSSTPNGFSGKYVDVEDASVFAGTIHRARGGSVVSFVQSLPGGDDRESYFAVYAGVFAGDEIRGSFHDVQGNVCSITMTRVK